MALSLFDEDDAVEPLTEAEVKLQIKLPVGVADTEDNLINNVIRPAVRIRCEQATNRQLREVTYDWTLRAFPSSTWLELPKPPLIEVVSIVYVNTAGVSTTWSSAQYTVTVPAGELPARGRIEPAYGYSWPTAREQPNAVTIRFRCGYGAADGPAVPALLKAGMLLDAASLYADRENVVKGTIVAAELPGGRRGIYWTCRSHATCAETA